MRIYDQRMEESLMLKKIAALCLCLTMLAALAVPALAETTQLTKLQGQWKSSGFRGTLSGQVTGEASGLTGEALWETLRTLFNTHELGITHTVKDSRVNEGEEAVITLTTKAGKEIGRLNVLSDASGVVYLQSDLLDEAGLYYAFDSGFDWTSMFNENGWPSMLHVLSEISGASKGWQEKANPFMEQVSLGITRWLQGYVTTNTEQDLNGTYITTATYEIPASAILQEAKQLLVDLYGNRDLLSLLAEVMTAEEQAAYLQKDMLLPFLGMLDKVKLDGSVSVRRQYATATGTVLYDSVTLPCPESLPVSSVTLVHVPSAAEGELWEFSVALDAQQLGIAVDQELRIDVTAQNTEPDVWTGSVLALLPASQNPEALNKEDQTLFSCTYNLNIPGPKDTNDFYASRYERLYEATLVVKPDEAMNLPAFSLGTKTVIYSKSSAASTVCYVESSLNLNDLDKDSAISLNFSGRTTSRWTPTMLTDALSSALRMDMMNAANRLELLGQLFGHLTQTLVSRIAQE